MTAEKQKMPNIMIWSWMSSVLHLSCNELLIFAYIFSMSFDNIHRCYTTLNAMEDWFSLSRQAVSRRIQNMVDQELLTKQTLVDSGFIKHNSYSVNMAKVTELCENSDYDTYKNFIESYGSALKQRFPADEIKIDNYLDSLIQWHEVKDTQVCLTMKQISDILLYEDAPDTITEVIELVSKQTKRVVPKVIKSPVSEPSITSDGSLFADIAPKKKPRLTRSMQAQEDKRQMAVDFVVHNYSGNEEIIDAINEYLDTPEGKKFTPDQWRKQLNNMYTYGITPERILEGINLSCANGWKSLYPKANGEADMRKKMELIDDYVSKECNNDSEIKDVLYAYLFEVPKAKSFSANQFKYALDDLSEICTTNEAKLQSIKMAYKRGWSALAYADSTVSASDAVVDMEPKHAAVNDFIKAGYYYLVDGLQDVLHKYVDTTANGRSMSLDAFKIVLENLRLYCLNDSEKISKVKLAIQNNYKYFATEDYAETRRLATKSEDRESAARSADHFRMTAVYAEMCKNPNNPKLRGVKLRGGD